jgi:MoxR-like ATPase
MEGVEKAVLNFHNLDKNVSRFMTNFEALKRADDTFHEKRDEEIKAAALAAAAQVKLDLDARHEARDISDKRFQHWMSAAALLVAIFMALIALREFQRNVSVETPKPGVFYPQPQTVGWG